MFANDVFKLPKEETWAKDLRMEIATVQKEISDDLRLKRKRQIHALGNFLESMTDLEVFLSDNGLEFDEGELAERIECFKDSLEVFGKITGKLILSDMMNLRTFNKDHYIQSSVEDCYDYEEHVLKGWELI